MKSWLTRIHSVFALKEPRNPKALWSLFLVSFSALYVEILLIRWIGTEVPVFAYFQNLALIACFLGFGLGCYWSKRPKPLLFDHMALAFLVLVVQLPFVYWKTFLSQLSNYLALLPDAALWGMPASYAKSEWLALFFASSMMVAALLLMLAATMVPLGQWVGTYLDAAPDPVRAYTVNLAGSVAGIWVFAGMAFLWLSPPYWFGLAFLILLASRPAGRRLHASDLVLLAGSMALLFYPGEAARKGYWSPYQKLEVKHLSDQRYQIYVNNTNYMSIANMTPDFLSRHPQIAESYRQLSPYDAPFRFAQHVDRVLIVGAGAGNDAAASLRNGAQWVDAVEIDPVLYSLGTRLHPEHPYSSPRVHKVINDARAFLRQAREEYDVIIFGLLDSHTQFSNFSNVRIDNYVYTEEAFRQAQRLLKPSGILVLRFEVRAPWTWMGQRFYSMLGHIFGRSPVVFYAPQLDALLSGTVFIVSNDASLWTRAAQPELKELIANHPPPFPLHAAPVPTPTTDDWPYVYHRSRTIPRAYLTISLILLGMSAWLVRSALRPKQPSTWYFFFLGAGFFLLETQLVSRLALYFGTTWIVNCVALSAILAMLVVANLFVTRWPPGRLAPYFVLLIACLVGIYFAPWQRIPYGSQTVGMLLAGAYCFPVFFAGVIFTESFRRCASKSDAFGANIVGAVAGGLAQNVSFVLGMKALLMVAALLYVSAGFWHTLENQWAQAKQP